jgi:hypothetical protein
MHQRARLLKGQRKEGPAGVAAHGGCGDAPRGDNGAHARGEPVGMMVVDAAAMAMMGMA